MMTTTHIHWCLLYTVSTWLEYNILSSDNFYSLVKNVWYAKQKQPGPVKKDSAKQSRINTIIEYDW